MATSTSRTWVFSKRELWCDFKAVGVGRGYRENFRRMIPAPFGGRRKLELGLAAAAAAVRGCKREEFKTTDQPPEIGIHKDPYKVSEEDERFMEEFRDAYPCIFSYTGQTFVVVICSQIVASPRLHGLLKGLYNDNIEQRVTEIPTQLSPRFLSAAFSF
ncbi:hypothetical protein SDJN03_11523, partial [Cucurbita argyrosperma subsp. sororia]